MRFSATCGMPMRTQRGSRRGWRLTLLLWRPRGMSHHAETSSHHAPLPRRSALHCVPRSRVSLKRHLAVGGFWGASGGGSWVVRGPRARDPNSSGNNEGIHGGPTYPLVALVTDSSFSIPFAISFFFTLLPCDERRRSDTVIFPLTILWFSFREVIR